MNKKYTQQEAEEKIENLGNKDFVLIGKYKGSNEYHKFKHLKCGKDFETRWSNFVDAFRQNSPHYKCPHCKIKKIE
ncbi:hypothetical protein FDB42_12555 [Clostridium botulinum]|nr:hypothetical protein [Clostridium botulinum]NFO40911.1 hypothetical protein [Clostridium botulinum]